MAKSRESDDGVSPAIKTAIVVVLILILLVIIIGGGVWLSATSAPPVHSVQNLVGMTLDQANAAADKANVHLIPHEEFSDSVEPNRVIRSDWDPSRPIQSGRTINVWVSRGGRMVWVPNLMRLSATDAESKLKDAGLTLGAVNRAYSKDVAPDCVVRQNPSAGKRVARDLPVNLTMSDGPNPTGGPEVAAGTPSADAGDNADSSNGGGNTDSSSSDSTSDDDASHSYTLRVAIPRDGRGVRRVRVEYEDAYGTQTPVDADHREGDVITKRVDAYGPRITVRVFYGDDLNPVSERTEKLRGQPQ